MEDKKEQRIFQVLPCYREDILALEAWLENMAAEGYMLKKFRWNGAVFVECEPVQVRYRFLPAPENKLINMGEPTERDNFIARHGENEWAYITSSGSLFVFLCRKAEIPEPKRDLYEIVDGIVRDNRSTMRSCLIAVITGIFGVWRNTGLGMLLGLMVGTWRYAGMIIPALYFILNSIVNHARLLKLQRSVKENTYEKQDTYSRDVIQEKHKRSAVIWLLMIVMLISSCSTIVLGLNNEKNEQPLCSFYDTLPFPLINDKAHEGAVQIVDMQKSTIRQWEDVLIPVAIEVSQYSDTMDDTTGEMIDIEYLGVDYFETRSSWIAKQLAKDYQRFDTRLRSATKDKHSVQELAELNLDYAVRYNVWWDTMILVKNNKMLRIRFSGYEYSADEIAQIYAGYLLSEEYETR